MAENKKILKVNVLGKLLGKRNIYLKSNSLFTSSLGGDTHLGSLYYCDTFASCQKGISGAEVHLYLGQKHLVFKHVDADSAEQFVADLNQKISERLAVNVERSFNEFFLLAIKEYPKDSNVAYLTELCQKIAQSYDSQPHLWSKYTDEMTLKKVNFLMQFHPIQPEQLRAYHEQRQLNHRSNFFDLLENDALTDEQKLAILRNNDRNLILSAAGTGKSSILVAKVLDLIDRGLATPEQILVLAYNNDAKELLQSKLVTKSARAEISLKYLPKISTFNQLELYIIEQAGFDFKLSNFVNDDVKLKVWISEWLKSYISEDPYRIFEFLELTTPRIDPFSFKTQSEYERYLRDNHFITLNGEVVRDYQEMQVANFLYINKIPYVYSPKYVSQRRFESANNYRPDFLIAGKIYLNHFAIDREANTRVDINTYKYNEAIRYKRNLHIECGTILIETYHYEWVEETLLDGLKQKLADHGVLTQPMSPQEIFARLREQNQPVIWIDLLFRALNALRAENLTHQMIFSRLYGAKLHQAAKHAKLLDALYQAYLAELKRQNTSDYADLTGITVNILQKAQFSSPWKYILIDEFQDVSTAQKALINALVESQDETSLTALGDDWQSTDRFDGSQIKYINQFDDYFGSHTFSELKKTFRYNSGIANVAGQFIMDNPVQYRKYINSRDQSRGSEVFLLDDGMDIEGGFERRIIQMVSQIALKDKQAKVAIMSHSDKILKKLADAVLPEIKTQNVQFVNYRQAKYLEVDYSILVGLYQGKDGFPSNNRQNILLEALLPLPDNYPHSEERRLFYVGLTRAKKQVYILSNPSAPSEFVLELLKSKYEIKILSDIFEAKNRQVFKCPCCTDGYFKKVKGINGFYYVCSSRMGCSLGFATVCEKCDSPMVDLHSERKCNSPKCKHSQKLCFRCGRTMHKQKNDSGTYWRCSGYNLEHDACSYTEDVAYRISLNSDSKCNTHR